MGAFTVSKDIGGLNAYRKATILASIAALIIGVFVSCEPAYTPTPKAAIKISAPASTEIERLSEQIKQLVKALEYSDKVAQDFAQIAIGWKDKQGRLVLVVWKQRLDQARQKYKQGKISKAQLAKVEESVAKQLSQRIRKEISYNEKLFDLADVIKNRQAQCLGYSQIFYLLGNSVGLSVKAINVVELITGILPPGAGHVVYIVSLTDGRTMMVDLAQVPFPMISKPFKLKKEFTKVGNYWELNDKDNPLGIHRRIQILDKNGLIAGIYNNRGVAYRKLGQYPKAISDYTRATQLNPKYAEAYSNRGVAHDKLGQHAKALSDFNRAIELDPKYAEAYYNRGTTYADLGQYPKAISDFTRAIEINPNDAEAYNNRGGAYNILGHHTKAISDFTKAIELNPKDAAAYNNRGVAYAALGKSEEAKKDLLKAVELDPALKTHIKTISDFFKLNLKLH